MPWPTDYATGVDVNSHVNVEAFRRAIFERAKAATGATRWPRCNTSLWNYGGEGTITALAYQSSGPHADTYKLTDSAAAWLVNDDDHINSPRWNNWTDPDVSELKVPRYYDIVLNCDDPDLTRHIHVQIVAQNDTSDGNTSVYISPTVINWVTAGWVPSIEWLVGKPYAIIKRGGVWWGERWPDQPNDHELWREDTSSRVSVVTVEDAAWQAGHYAGKVFHRSGKVDAIIIDNGADWFAVERYNDGDSNLPAAGQAFEIQDGGVALVKDVEVAELLDGIRDPSWKLKPATFIDGDLLIYNTAGRVVRIEVIEFATRTLIAFARQDLPVDGGFSIVTAGDRAWPARKPWPIHQWYGGAMEDYFSHKAGDIVFNSVSATAMPKESIRYSSGEDPLFCEDTTFEAFDIDVWSLLSEECSEADKCFSPHLYKTWRGLQNAVLQLCTLFVLVDNYHAKSAIPFCTPATLFERIGVNFVGRFTGVADEDGNVTITFPAQPVDPYWTFFSYTGDVGAHGRGYAGGTFTASGLVAGKTYTLAVALGWSRYVPREFRYAYPRSAFIPDLETDDEGNQHVVDPPTQEYPGLWVDRDRSSVYKRYEPRGFGRDLGAEFANGVRARYVGDNWGDPTVEPNAATSEGLLDAQYWSNLWEGRFTKSERPGYAAKKQGFVEYGGKKWFRTRGVDWWSPPIALDTEPMRAESGTATAGTTTTLTLTAKWYTPTPTEDDPDPDPLPDPFWAGDRFVDMMLEVDQEIEEEDDGDDDEGETQLITYRTPITGVVTTPGTPAAKGTSVITFKPVPAYTIPAVLDEDGNIITAAVEVPALDVNNANAFRILEPKYRRNWFQGRKVTIINPDGETATVKITHHDRKTMWLAEELEFDIAPGATWRIEELDVGNVYVWDADGDDFAGEWIEPSMVSNPRSLPLAHLLPKNDKTYGEVMAGDYLGGHVYQELYDAINALQWTYRDLNWSSRANPAIAENNHQSVSYGSLADLPPPDDVLIHGWTDFGAMQGYIAEDIAYALANHLYDYDELNSAPVSRDGHNASAVPTDTNGDGIADAPRYDSAGSIECLYAYAVLTLPTDQVEVNEVEFFAFAVVDLDDPEPSIDSFPNDTGTSYVVYDFFSYGGTLWRKWTTFGVESGYQEQYRHRFAGPMEVPGLLWPGLSMGDSAGVVSGCLVSKQLAIVKWDFEYQA